MQFRIKKMTRLALLVCAGLVLQVLEGLVPAFSVIPGGKLGIANIATMAAMSMYGGKEAFCVCVLRSVIGCLFGGGVSAMMYSVSGAIVSCVVIVFLARKSKKPKKLSWAGISMLAAAAHNFTQVSVAVMVLSDIYVYTYLPPLLVVSVVSGMATGVAFLAMEKKIVKL